MWTLEGHLRNSAGDIIVDSILLLAIVCSYLPQIACLRNSASSSSSGLSPHYLLFGALFSTAQLSDVTFSADFIWPTKREAILKEISHGRLRGMKAFGGLLGLLQVFVQWACSIALISTFVYNSTSSSLRKILSTIVLLYLAVVLLPTLVISFPEPTNEMVLSMLTYLISFSNKIVAPAGLLLQFIFQFIEKWKQNGVPGALSLLSLCLQIPVMTALAMRWYLRVQTPTWGDQSLDMMYMWGMPVINYAVCAFGYAVLLASYYLASRGGEGEAVSEQSDREPLLG